MRVVPFLQVFVLLLLLAYSFLVALENPQLIRFPLPFGRGEYLLPTGMAIGMALLTGVGYALLLFLPPLVQVQRGWRRSRRAEKQLERRLAATLQARLAVGKVSNEWKQVQE